MVFGGIEREHQVEHHLIYLLGTAVRLVHLVHHNDRLQTYLQCLLQHEARLRHRSLESVHEQQAAVCHVEHALHLAAEVRVPRSVDDVNLNAFVVYRNVFRQNCYPSLAFQVIAVQHLVAKVLPFAEQVSCQHHFIYECCLSVVNVSDNRNVPNVLHSSLSL